MHTCARIVCVHDTHGRCVGDSWHGGLLSLLFPPVDDEEDQEEQDQDHQNHNSGYGSYLVGVGQHHSAGQAVEIACDDHTSCGGVVEHLSLMVYRSF